MKNNNTGKKSTTYMATMPDGTNVKKNSFNINTEYAYIAAFLHNGIWVVSGVTDSPKEWGSQCFFLAKKI